MEVIKQPNTTHLRENRCPPEKGFAFIGMLGMAPWGLGDVRLSTCNQSLHLSDSIGQHNIQIRC
jgi:hypothetical protein